jgi:hypothetical protein
MIRESMMVGTLPCVFCVLCYIFKFNMPCSLALRPENLDNKEYAKHKK